MSSALLERMRRAVDEHRMSGLEVAMAEWALRHDDDPVIALALAAVTRALQDGHSCLPLEAVEIAVPGESAYCDTPRLLEALDTSALVGQPGDSRPLILDGDRLYLHRYWQYEIRLADSLRGLLEQPAEPVDTTPLLAGQALFRYDALPEGASHWQAVAAAVALRHRLSVISGGPGTGKTYTVLRLMRLLIEAALHTGQAAPVIRLAAPTGKAAARMVESIQAGLEEMALSEAVAAHIPGEAQTLHRLLGLGFGSTLPRHGADDPLAADVVIIDEASMVDLPMMAKLVAALPPQARLILLGDRYQLASVESGSVMAEICDAAGVNRFSRNQQQALAPLLDQATPQIDTGRIDDHVVTLMISHRFDANSEIGRLANSVNHGDADEALQRLSEAAAQNPDRWRQRVDADSLNAIAEETARHFEALIRCDQPRAALDLLGQRCLLCALRVGPSGSRSMNLRVTERLAERFGFDSRRRWFHGRPVIILANDYRARLFNGDTGVCLQDDEGHLRVWFQTEAGLRSFLPTALPEHDSVYAMTVHKSQGSEFGHVSLLLPAEDNPVLSRELIYTALTRARDSVDISASSEVLKAAIERRTLRYSGLKKRLA